MAALPAAALGAAEEGAVARITLDTGLANSGEWGDATGALGSTPDEPLLKVRDGGGVADFTRGWFHVRGGRLLCGHGKIAAMNAFAASISFDPMRTGSIATLFMRLFQ